MYNRGLFIVGLLAVVGFSCSPPKSMNPRLSYRDLQRGNYPIGIVTHARFAPALVDSLAIRYDTDTLEFFFCLGGTVRGDTLILNKMVEPYYVQRTPVSVTYGRCPAHTLADIHSHPSPYSCGFSDVDITSFKNALNYHGEAMWANFVICRDSPTSGPRLITLTWKQLRYIEKHYVYRIYTPAEIARSWPDGDTIPRAKWPN